MPVFTGIAAALPSLMGIAEGVFSGSTVFKWVNLAMGIVIEGIEVRKRMAALDDQIKMFIAEDREPTADEWRSMMARSDAAHDIIQNA